MKPDGFGLFVDDMAEMIRFYRDVLGFEIKEAEDAGNVTGRFIRWLAETAKADAMPVRTDTAYKMPCRRVCTFPQIRLDFLDGCTFPASPCYNPIRSCA